MKIAILGASGFIGLNLTKYLLLNTNYDVVALCRNTSELKKYSKFGERLSVIKIDIFDTDSLTKYISGADAVFYLVHMMGSKKDFYKEEVRAAKSFGIAAKKAEVPRVIYMSGLGNDSDNLSKHLKSRHITGDILRKHISLVIEFRSSIIIGEGGISFEILKNTIEKMRIIILPKFSKTLTQPIGIDDVISYLGASIEAPIKKHEIIEIGGPEIMSYEQLLRKYSSFLNKKNIFIYIPLIPDFLVGMGFYLFNPKHIARVGKNMVSSFKNEMIVTNSKSKQIFPDIKPLDIKQYFK